MKLIDADKVIEKLEDGIVIRPVTPFGLRTKDYRAGRTDALINFKAMINQGDFDPPKYSSVLVDVAKAEINSLRLLAKKYEQEEFCDHLIEYLEQLKESK